MIAPSSDPGPRLGAERIQALTAALRAAKTPAALRACCVELATVLRELPRSLRRTDPRAGLLCTLLSPLAKQDEEYRGDDALAGELRRLSQEVQRLVE